MGQAPSFTQRVHQCLCSNDRAELQRLMAQPAFVAANLSDDILVELAERHCDSGLIDRFVKVAKDDQLAVLLASCILYTHVYRLDALFAAMRDARGTIARHQLQHLFLTVCDRGDGDDIAAMLTAGCYDAGDARVVRTVVRRALDSSVADENTVRAVLRAHPGHGKVAEQLRSTYVPASRNAASRDMVDALLREYTTTTAA